MGVASYVRRCSRVPVWRGVPGRCLPLFEACASREAHRSSALSCRCPSSVRYFMSRPCSISWFSLGKCAALPSVDTRSSVLSVIYNHTYTGGKETCFSAKEGERMELRGWHIYITPRR